MAAVFTAEWKDYQLWGNWFQLGSLVTRETSRGAWPLTTPLMRTITNWGLRQIHRKVSHVHKIRMKQVLVQQGMYREQENNHLEWADHRGSFLPQWGEWLFVVQSLSCVWLFATPWTACSTLGFPVLHHLPELAQTHVHWVSDAIQPSRPLASPSPPAFPSIRVFSNESVLCIRWPKYWSFSINPSNEYSGLISFRIDWFDLLAVQGTLKSLLQGIIIIHF